MNNIKKAKPDYKWLFDLNRDELHNECLNLIAERESIANELERIAEEIPLFLMKRNMGGVLMDCKKLEDLAKELRNAE